MRHVVYLLSLALVTATATGAGAVVTPIGDLHFNTAAGLPLRLGEVVTIQGTVVLPHGILSATNIDVHIQDATGAIDIFVSGGIGTYSFALDDDVEVTGTVTHFNGLTELVNPITVTHLGPASVPPVPLEITTLELASSYHAGNHEPNESRLIRINGASITSGTWPTTVLAGNSILTINDGSGPATLFIDRDSPVNGSPLPTPVFDIIGVLRQFDSSNPYTTGFQLVPRFTSDVIGTAVCSGPSFVGVPEPGAFSSTSATISWTTEAASTSFVLYGLTAGVYTDITGDATPTTNHTVVLTGLAPRTLYYFQAKSTDANGTCYSIERPFVTFPSPGTPGEINVYFTQSVDHSVSSGTLAAGNVDVTVPLIALIDAADVSLDCALYYFDIPAVTDALIAAKNRGVVVRLITGAGSPLTEANRLAVEGIPFILSNYGGNHASGIMHDKYVVADVQSTDKNAARVWTGSWNCFPNNEANNVIVFQDYGLAVAYTLDFDQMWGSATTTPNAATAKMGDRKTEVIPHQFEIGGVRVEAFMSPSDQPEVRMIQYIQQAQYSQLFCIFDFTSDPLSLAMRAHRDSVPGFVVRGSFEGGQVGPFSEWCKLDGQVACPDYWTPRAEVFQNFEPSFTLVHHKYQILDHGHPGATVWTGSHNWSAAAKTTNDENTVVIHDPTIANLYFQEWAARDFESSGSPVQVAAYTPARLALSPCFPNPASQTTTFEYGFAAPAGSTHLAIYDLSGRRVRTLVNGPAGAGTHRVTWDGRNDAGERERPGIYFYRLRVGTESLARVLVLTR